MPCLARFALLVAMPALLAGCQAAAPSMSLEDAKRVTASFSGQFVPPPRGIDDLLEKLPKASDKTGGCKFESPITDEEFRATMASLPPPVQGKGGRVGYAEKRAFRAFEVGRYADAVKYMKAVLEAIAPNLHGYIISRTARYATLLAYAGEYDAAASEVAYADGLMATTNTVNWRQSSFDSNNYLLNDALGAVAQSKGRLTEAEAHYRLALDYQAKVPFSTKYINWGYYTRIELAGNLMRQGRLLEAENVLRELIELLPVYDYDSPALGKALGRLSAVLYEQGQYRDAEVLARATLRVYAALCAAPENLNVARTRDVLGKSLVAQERWAQAIEVYETARTAMAGDPGSYDRLFAGNLSRALALIRAGRTEEAEAALRKALARSRDRLGEDHYKTAEIQGFLAMTRAARGDKGGALADFAAAADSLIERARDADDTDTSFGARDRRLAIILGAYIDLLADLRGTPILTKAGIDAAAASFRLAEAARARTVQRALSASGARASLGDPRLVDLARREQDLQRQIATLYAALSASAAQSPNAGPAPKSLAAIDELRQARRALIGELESRFPAYAELIRPRPATVAQTQKLLRPGEVLISTYVGARRSFIWVVPRQGPIAFQPIEIARQDLEAQVGAVRATLDPGAIRTLGDIPPFAYAAAHGLYETLLEPVRAHWQSADRLIVVAHGALGQLPFSLLPTAAAPPTPNDSGQGLLFAHYRKAPWLARRHAVTMMPSVGALASLRGGNPTLAANPRPFVGFGDPVFSETQAAAAPARPERVAEASETETRGGPIRLRAAPMTRGAGSATLAALPRLPDTRPELLSIARSLGADPQGAVFLGADASEERVKSMDLSGVGVLAFATHGLVPGDLNGLDQPALALSAPAVTGGAGDGLLSMGEILGLKINAEWVVLSACNTAAADGQGAEAVSGLGRAFFYAGARALLVSNWPVHSAATTELMTTLFAADASEPSPGRAEALRRARLHLIDTVVFKDQAGEPIFSYAHPIFWAPFTIVGDGGVGGVAG